MLKHFRQLKKDQADLHLSTDITELKVLFITRTVINTDSNL